MKSNERKLKILIQDMEPLKLLILTLTLTNDAHLSHNRNL